MTLQDAIEKIKSNKDLARRFTTDPKGVLTELGVDTSSVKVGPIIDAKPHEFTPYVSACGSIGCVVCASVGS